MDKNKQLNVTASPIPLALRMSACRQWYDTPKGLQTLQHLQTLTSILISDIFGYYALEMGVLAGHATFLQNSRIASHYALGSIPRENNDLLALPEQLPIAFSNIDLIIASHVLECSQHPHQILREIERVLLPEGHCILIGFNPLSFCGLKRLLLWQKYRAMPQHFYSTFRVRDWLNVLGFEVLSTLSCKTPAALLSAVTQYHTGTERWQDKFPLVTGNVYLIHAQKKVSNLTPLPTSRKAMPVLRPGMVVNPGAGRVAGQKNQQSESL